MTRLITSLKVFFFFALLLGLIYPLFVMLLGQTIFPKEANGSLIKRNGKVIGSSLIAQKFSKPRYFHSRFSAVNYDASSSGGSNLALSSRDMYKQTKKHVESVRNENDLPKILSLPSDSVLSSASGLDPHISLTNALIQLPRVARRRGLSKKVMRRLIHKYSEHDFIGIWGQTGVNVLQLNLALDKL